MERGAQAGPERLLDPVTFGVILNRLSGIVREMQDAIFRTGYSTIVRESQDASCMLLDTNGDVVGEHVILPLHVTSLPEAVRGVRRYFGDDVAPGDAFITNHPYEGGVAHSMDMAVIAPVYYAGALVAFCGSIAHKSDLGGVVPGTSYGSARELFQEGIQYPPLRFVHGGEIVRDIEAILRANSRTPELVLGDLRGQVGVARLGERRLGELAARYGIDTLLDAFAHKLDVTERRFRAGIAAWPDGVHEAESHVDHDGVSPDRRVRYHVRIEKRGDRISFDFTGCDDQAPGPLNIRPPLVRGCIYQSLIAMIDPALPNDGGLARVVETRFRRGSAVDPYFPAACSAYTPSTNAVIEALIDALGAFDPTRRCARTGGQGGMSIAGRRPDGSTFVQYELVGSAYGGIVGMDGQSGQSTYSNAFTAPIEIIESEFPTRVRRFELIEDCGGPGEFRGGLSQRRVYEILTGDAQVSLRGGLHKWPAAGKDGGLPGRLGSFTINPGTPEAVALPNRVGAVPVRDGDVVALEKAGGGGLGDPRRRPFAKVLDDVLDGYVSRASAVAHYGADPSRLDAELARWGA
jgi:N-methylhydantoinase B